MKTVYLFLPLALVFTACTRQNSSRLDDATSSVSPIGKTAAESEKNSESLSAENSSLEIAVPLIASISEIIEDEDEFINDEGDDPMLIADESLDDSLDQMQSDGGEEQSTPLQEEQQESGPDEQHDSIENENEQNFDIGSEPSEEDDYADND
ncbi:MAG: hypothetical protein FJZ56_00180 [Chlamydiae bacterium]|nr:hypothetical protein [Chlamydiota bacterium]